MQRTVNAYATQLGTNLDNVTPRVYDDTNTTLSPLPAEINYGDTLDVNGAVRSNQTGVSNGTVDIAIDNNVVAHVSTNASGFYEGAFAVDQLTPGTHTVTAQFRPTDVPFNPSSSTAQSVTIGTLAVSTTLRISAGSLQQNSVTFSGTLMTDKGVPVRNATVLLLVNNKTYRGVQTDENGACSWHTARAFRTFWHHFLRQASFPFTRFLIQMAPH